MIALAAAAQPQRIVSTAPSATEILYALGLGDRVVGVTTYCHYPPAARSKPKIGTYLAPNFEAILAARPDLVVVVKNPVRLADRLKDLGLKVLELSEETLPGIADSIQRVGDATGASQRATDLNRDVKEELARIELATKSRPRKTMTFLVSRTPGRLEGLMVVGQASYLNSLIRLAGGENVFGDARVSYAKISLEDLFSRDPEVIVDMGEMAETTGVTEGQKDAVVKLWRERPTLKAVRQGRVFAVASDYFVVPGPRAVDAAAAFARMLHPDLKF